MDTSMHTLSMLFFQLGLPNEDNQIRDFIERHKFLPRHIALPDADFWTEAQAAFLAEAIENDSDWCATVDELDALMREQYSWTNSAAC